MLSLVGFDVCAPMCVCNASLTALVTRFFVRVKKRYWGVVMMIIGCVFRCVYVCVCRYAFVYYVCTYSCPMWQHIWPRSTPGHWLFRCRIDRWSALLGLMGCATRDTTLLFSPCLKRQLPLCLAPMHTSANEATYTKLPYLWLLMRFLIFQAAPSLLVDAWFLGTPNAYMHKSHLHACDVFLAHFLHSLVPVRQRTK